jgi:hypothetical protein
MVPGITCGLRTIGIVPAYASLHRANQHFRKEQGVYDVMHYEDFGRVKRRITPFVAWEPLPIIAATQWPQ